MTNIHQHLLGSQINKLYEQQHTEICPAHVPVSDRTVR